MTDTLQVSVRSFHVKFNVLMKVTLLVLLFVPEATGGEMRSIYKFMSFRQRETDLWTLKGSYTKNHIIINAGAPWPRTLEIVGPLETIFVKFRCDLNYLDTNERPQTVDLFFNGHNRTMQPKEFGYPSIVTDERDGYNVTYYYYLNSTGYGMDFGLPVKKGEVIREIKMRCRAHNRQGSLMSNLVTIRDFRGFLMSDYKYSRRGRWTKQYDEENVERWDTTYLMCFRAITKNLNFSHKLQVEWDDYTPISAGRKRRYIPKEYTDITTYRKAAPELWPRWIDEIGTLQWDYTPHFLRGIPSLHADNDFFRYYKCTVGGHIYATYQLKYDLRFERELNLTLVSSDIVNITVNDLDSHKFYLPMSVKGSDNNTEYIWIHDDQKVLRSAGTTMKPARLPHCTWPLYSVVPQCSGPFYDVYTIVMTAKAKSTELTVTYNIIPQNVRLVQMSNDTPGHVFGVAGRSVSFTCKLKDTDKEITLSLRGKRTVHLNVLEGMPKEINYEYEPYMAPVKIIVNKTTQSELYIKVEDIKYNDDLSSSFYLTCGTSGDVELRHQIMVTALPMPSFRNFTLTNNGEYAIVSAFTQDALKKWTQHGVDATCLWSFDNIPLSRFYSMFNWPGSPNDCTVRFPYSLLRSYESLAIYFVLENLFVDKNHTNRCIFAVKKNFGTGYDKNRAKENRKKFPIRRICTKREFIVYKTPSK